MLQTSALPESNHRMPQLPCRLGEPPLHSRETTPQGSHSGWEVERLGPGSPCGASARWPPRGILSPLPTLSHLQSIATPRAPVSEISGSCPSSCLPSIICALPRGPAWLITFSQGSVLRGKADSWAVEEGAGLGKSPGSRCPWPRGWDLGRGLAGLRRPEGERGLSLRALTRQLAEEPGVSELPRSLAMGSGRWERS